MLFGKAREGEQLLAGLLQTVGYCAAFQPPLANEGFPLRLDLLLRVRIDHVGVVGRDFLMQPVGRRREDYGAYARRS